MQFHFTHLLKSRPSLRELPWWRDQLVTVFFFCLYTADFYFSILFTCVSLASVLEPLQGTTVVKLQRKFTVTIYGKEHIGLYWNCVLHCLPKINQLYVKRARFEKVRSILDIFAYCAGSSENILLNFQFGGMHWRKERKRHIVHLIGGNNLWIVWLDQ